MLANALLILFVSLFIPFYVFKYSFLIMSHNASDSYVATPELSSRAEDTSQAAGADAAGDTQVVDIEIDRGVPGRLVAEYRTRCSDTLDSRWFCAVLFGGGNSLMFDC